MNSRKVYAEAMITDGNRLFNKGKYEEAARMYENAARWSSIELLDKELNHEAFRLAINSWISACMAENASRIIEGLSQEIRIVILKEIINKILAEVNYLVNNNNHKLAIEHLNIFIKLYHDNNLISELKKLNEKQLYILEMMMKRGLKKKPKKI